METVTSLTRTILLQKKYIKQLQLVIKKSNTLNSEIINLNKNLFGINDDILKLVKSELIWAYFRDVIIIAIVLTLIVVAMLP